MISRIGKRARALRRRMSRTQWLAKLLGLPEPGHESDAPGLIILQLDGLSRTQFEAAVKNRRLPFLSMLTRYGHFELASFYSGMPSTTPAVQSEVMFGIRSAVPAFSFLDRQSGRVFHMFDGDCANTINDRNMERGHPLLVGGRSISNIFAGGSEYPRFCTQQMTMETAKKELRPVRVLTIVCLYFFTVLRVLGLLVIELLAGLADMIQGVIDRRDWRSEMKFVGSRVAVSALLRELARINVKLAIQQGSPIIYANFLGYDEQAHRRGPSSGFAHWALKGVDGVFRDIHRTARRSNLRDYEIVVFSDHGQEAVRSYETEYGQSVDEAARQAFASGPLSQYTVNNLGDRRQSYNLDQRARNMLRVRRGRMDIGLLSEEQLANEIVVTAMGPIGHIYLPIPIPFQGRATYARLLVDEHHVPLVVTRNEEDGKIHAWNSQGTWQLPDDAAAVLGDDHPFLDQVTIDLETLCDHENAGDLMIFGWSPGQQPITFVGENGAHGSVGKEETRGFALIPQELRAAIQRPQNGESFTRGHALHNAAWEFIHGESDTSEDLENSPPISPRQHEPGTTIRVMTYNIHSCIGPDGKLRPNRVADVIAAADADIICLQEVDEGLARTNFGNQSALIADRLGMHRAFFPVQVCGKGRYGLAILSRFPIQLRRTDCFPATKFRRPREARGAMWAEVDCYGIPVHVINTHLGLQQKERHQQVTTLLEEQWLRVVPPGEPIIICGDLNAGPKSKVVTRLSRFLDTENMARKPNPRARTFPSPFPLRQIDHILFNDRLTCQHLNRVRTLNAMSASDHLPVVADLAVSGNAHVSSDSSINLATELQGYAGDQSEAEA